MVLNQITGFLNIYAEMDIRNIGQTFSFLYHRGRQKRFHRCKWLRNMLSQFHLMSSWSKESQKLKKLLNLNKIFKNNLSFLNELNVIFEWKVCCWYPVFVFTLFNKFVLTLVSVVSFNSQFYQHWILNRINIFLYSWIEEMKDACVQCGKWSFFLIWQDQS